MCVIQKFYDGSFTNLMMLLKMVIFSYKETS